MLRNWKGFFRQAGFPAASEDRLEEELLPLSAAHSGPPEPSYAGTGASSPQRLSLTFPKRTIFDFTHLIPPFDLESQVTDRTRWQIKEAMRDAVCEKRSADESIIAFAELIVLCGFEGSPREARRMVDPAEAVAMAERYYKRSAAWKASIETGRPEAERINLSKEVYASENQILNLLSNLRSLYARLATEGPELDREEEDRDEDESASLDGDAGDASLGTNRTLAAENGAEAGPAAVENGTEGAAPEAEPAPEPLTPEEEPVRDGEELYAHRRVAFCELKLKNRFEDAYIAFREKIPEKVERHVEDREPRQAAGGGGVSLDTLLQLMAVMQGGMGGAGKQQVLPADAAAAPAEAPKVQARKMRTDADFSVKEKDRLIQVIYSCEAQGLKFDRDYETLEAMVYRKPSQVVLVLSQKVDDPVFYLS